MAIWGVEVGIIGGISVLMQCLVGSVLWRSDGNVGGINFGGFGLKEGKRQEGGNGGKSGRDFSGFREEEVEGKMVERI